MASIYEESQPINGPQPTLNLTSDAIFLLCLRLHFVCSRTTVEMDLRALVKSDYDG